MKGYKTVGFEHNKAEDEIDDNGEKIETQQYHMLRQTQLFSYLYFHIKRPRDALI